MYLIDTNVISERRKEARANVGVQAFFDRAVRARIELYLSVITVGELRRGTDMLRHRNDHVQADLLERWLHEILTDYNGKILDVDVDVVEYGGKLRVPQSDHAIDKLIAATALTYDLTLVTRNPSDFTGTGVMLLNPFT
jgi:toxin FitB